jgi:hypothetical protein
MLKFVHGVQASNWAQGLYVAAGAAYVDNDYDLTTCWSGSNTLK